MDFETEFLKALDEDRAYGFIANEYWRMSNQDLRDICLECIYELMQPDSDISVVAENLKELWGK